MRNLPNRAQITIATKGGFTRPGGRWETDGRPESLRRACEQSLRDLDVDTIVLYQYHSPDSSVPFTDSVGELARLRDEGKIEHVGLSNVDRHHIDTARKIVPIVSVQNRCNVLYKHDLTSGLLDYCGVQGITYIPYSPVGGGQRPQAAASGGDVIRDCRATRYQRLLYCAGLAFT